MKNKQNNGGTMKEVDERCNAHNSSVFSVVNLMKFNSVHHKR
jgi:hypothetical protein